MTTPATVICTSKGVDCLCKPFIVQLQGDGILVSHRDLIEKAIDRDGVRLGPYMIQWQQARPE